MKEIKLTQGKFAIVDDEDFDYLNQFKWHCTINGYAARRECYKNEKSTIKLMHRVILNAPKGLDVDHTDHDKLNNQRHNLRLATRAQNQSNRIKSLGNTKYKGVHFLKRYLYYIAYIDHKTKRIRLGNFGSAVVAAMAYDQAAIKFKGEFALTNFPRYIYD